MHTHPLACMHSRTRAPDNIKPAFAFGVFFCGNKRVKAARVTRSDHAPRDRPINARPKRGEYAPITGDDDW